MIDVCMSYCVLCGNAIGDDNKCVYCDEEGSLDNGSYCCMCGNFAGTCKCMSI